MNHIKDLNLESEIIPLFDYTPNDYAKERLYQLFQMPLPSVAALQERQHIIKGLLAHHHLLHSYWYARIDFCEVYHFLHDLAFHEKVINVGWKYIFLNKEKHRNQSKFIQLVVFFHKIESAYLKQIQLDPFPESYQKELRFIVEFMSMFQLDYYENLIREGQFEAKHIIALSNNIVKMHTNKEMDVFFQRFFLLESYISIGKCTYNRNFTFPSFSKHTLSMENMYHPVLKHPIKNRFSSNHNVVLLTGPNMSGKSTLLKSIGLCIYLAHIGVSVPADKMELPFFKHLSAAIHHNDDLQNGYSHFMNELMVLKQAVLNAAADSSVAIFDELFKGTNMEDAVQILSTTIKGLKKFGNSFFFISTHLNQLKDLEIVKNGQVDTYYVDCDIIDEEPIFNYELKKGWSDLKVGQLLFEKVGLSKLLATGE